MFTDLLFSFTQWCSAIIIIIFLATRFAIEMGFKSEDLHTNHSWWVISKEGIELVLSIFTTWADHIIWCCPIHANEYPAFVLYICLEKGVIHEC